MPGAGNATYCNVIIPYNIPKVKLFFAFFVFFFAFFLFFFAFFRWWVTRVFLCWLVCRATACVRRWARALSLYIYIYVLYSALLLCSSPPPVLCCRLLLLLCLLFAFFAVSEIPTKKVRISILPCGVRFLGELDDPMAFYEIAAAANAGTFLRF